MWTKPAKTRAEGAEEMGKLLGDDMEASADVFLPDEDEEVRRPEGWQRQWRHLHQSRDESAEAAIDEPVVEDEEGGEELHVQGDTGREQDKALDRDEVGLDAEEREARAKEQEIADAAIKILRLVANVAIESKVGAHLASDSQALTVVVQLLGEHCNEAALAMASSPDSGNGFSEELLLNIVAACTNISYYACIKASTFSHVDLGPPPTHREREGAESRGLDLSMSFDESVDLSALHREGEEEKDGDGDLDSEEGKQKQILRTLLKMTSHLSSALFHSNDEIVLESARAVGNLTRLPHVLSSLSSSRTDEALVLLLGHHHMEVVAAVAGTLVNLSAHAPNKHSLLLRTAVPSMLVKALRRSSLRHMTTSMLISQVFHNLLSTGNPGSGDNAKEEETPAAACEFPGLMETLDELVDLALEMTEREDDKYAGFAKVGGAVRDLLIQRDRGQGREWAKAERGTPAYYVEEEDDEDN